MAIRSEYPRIAAVESAWPDLHHILEGETKDLMNSTRIRISGAVGMASAVLWLIALAIEYNFQLFPPGDGSALYVVDQVVFAAATAGYLFMLTGLWQSRAAGEGRFGKIALGMFIAAISALFIGQVIGTLTSYDLGAYLLPIVGILQLFGGLLTGIAIIAARKWNGWQRFAPMLHGSYYLFLFILLAAFDQEPTQLTEGIWQVTWFITSLALFTKSGTLTGRLLGRVEA